MCVWWAGVPCLADARIGEVWEGWGGNDRGILLPQERTRAQHLPDLRLRCSRARLIEKTPNCCTVVPELRKNSGCAKISVRDWVAARREQKGI